jgi:phage terminase Nu1 subunit (DNA packaging protein)
MEVNKKQLADIFGASIRTIQNWQEQGMPVLRGGGKGNEVLYDSAAVIKWYAERDAEIENEKLRREVEELRQASEADLQPGTIEYERHRLTRAQADAQELKNARDSAEVVEVDHLIILNTVLTLLLQALIRTLYRVLLQAQVHTHILSVLVLIRTPLRLVHMDIPSPLTLLVTRKTPSKTSHLTIL